MLIVVIAFIIIGALIGYIYKGNKGIGEGAAGGFSFIVAIGSAVAIPLMVIILFIKACS